MKSSGLPPPLDKQLIDISANPGRRELQQGFVEAVGSQIWIGDLFWPRTGADKSEVLSADWLECEVLNRGILRIKAWLELFTSADGKQGEIQTALRELLFPSSLSNLG